MDRAVLATPPALGPILLWRTDPVESLLIDGVPVKPIPDFPDYCVSEEGIVYSRRAGRTTKPRAWKTLKLKPHCNGCICVTLYREPYKGEAWLVHRLVMLAFVGPCPEGHQVKHLDGNLKNNRLSNLIYKRRKGDRTREKWWQERKERCRREGRCLWCGKESYSGQLRCKRCRSQANNRSWIRRIKLQEAGLCTSCGKSPPRPGKKVCLTCLEKFRRRAAGYYAAGICYACSNPRLPKSRFCQKHWEEVREREKQNRLRLREEIIHAYGGPVCACCGLDRIEFLQVDHINGGGKRHRKEIMKKEKKNFYAWLKAHNFPPGFQILCANCNLAKGIHGICPHQRGRVQEGCHRG